ncbi:unnamed protein product, partial [Notodromas monacha]
NCCGDICEQIELTFSFAFHPIRVQGAGRRDKGEEAEVSAWIAAVLGEAAPPGLQYDDYLRDGQVLCRLMNTLQPGIIKKINTSGAQFKFMENINNFQKALLAYGVPELDVFQTTDLFEKKDIPMVTKTLYALGRTTYKHPEFPGPQLGPKPAEENKREFDDETLAAGKAVIGLQAGTNKGASQAGQSFGAGRHIILGK